MSYFEYECQQSAEFQTGAYRGLQKKRSRVFFLRLLFLSWGVSRSTRRLAACLLCGRLSFAAFVHNLWHFIASQLLMSLLKKTKEKEVGK